MKKTLAIIAIIAAIIIGALFLTKTQTPITTQNTTENKTTGATYGDLVSINFILTLENGTIVDTNNEEIAKQNGIKDYVQGPFTFIMAQSGKVAGFDDALLGMNPGDHRETIIEPSEKEIVLTAEKTQTQRRHITINKKQSFPLKSFETYFKKQPKIGDIIHSDKFAFKYKILNITENNVIAEIHAKEGEAYTLPNTEWKSSIVRMAENDIMFYQQPTENQTLKTPFGPATINYTQSMMFINYQPQIGTVFNKSLEVTNGFSIPQEFIITDVNEKTFTIKRHNALAEQRLKITIDLLNLTKDVKEVKRTTPRITEVITGTEN